MNDKDGGTPVPKHNENADGVQINGHRQLVGVLVGLSCSRVFIFALTGQFKNGLFPGGPERDVLSLAFARLSVLGFLALMGPKNKILAASQSAESPLPHGALRSLPFQKASPPLWYHASPMLCH